MNTQLYVYWAGMHFRVEADLYEDNPGVEQVNRVEIQIENGDYVEVDVELGEFQENLQDVLNEAAEEYVEERAIAYAEEKSDMEREEVND